MERTAMEVTVLGWNGAFPKPGGATCGVMIRTGEGVLLLDCGSGVLGQYLRFGTGAELRGILLSHLHFDHMGDVGSLGYLLKHDLRLGLRREEVPLRCPAAPAAAFQSLHDSCYRMEPVTGGMSFGLAGFSVKTLALSHPVECYAYRLEREGKSLGYFSDSTWREEAPAFLAGVDLLICEATITEGSTHSTGIGHISDLDAGRLARAAGAKELCLYHLPGDGDPAVMAERAASRYGGPVWTPETKQVFRL